MKKRDVIVALVTVVTVLILFLAAKDYLNYGESNRCKMSYMFRNPFLRPLALTPPPRARLEGYQLFYYCSGQCRPFATENALPVLFLPGTRGSFKTIRSFASVQDYFQGNKAFQFDFFAVDFNEETTALSGNLIERQAEYVALSVDGILSLYVQSKNPPTSVIIVGHSLGILAAVYLLSNPQFDRNKITTVISLAGPLLDPIYSPGPVMDRVYDRVGTYFKRIAADSTHPLVVLSLTGGSRDVLVSDILGAVDLPAPGLNVLWLSTSSISHVWASCDHLCILWCRQLMHVLTFVLQDLRLLSAATQQQQQDHLNASTRLRVLRDRLISVPVCLDRTELMVTQSPPSPLQVDRLPPGQWVFRVRQQTFRYTGILPAKGQFTKIGPFFDNPDQRVLITTNHVFGDWLFICVDPKRWVPAKQSTDDEHPCSQLIPLRKPYVTWVPEYESAFAQGLALLTLPLVAANTDRNISAGFMHNRHGILRQGSYLVVVHPPPPYPNSRVELMLETFTDPEERLLHVSNAHIPWHRPMRLKVKRTRSLTGSEQLLSGFHRIRFPNDRFLFNPSLPAPRLTVTNIRCTIPMPDGQGLMTLYAPWANYFYHSFISGNSLNTLDLDVPSAQPNAADNESLFVDLFLKPYCTYTISIHLSLFQWIGKLFRLHWAHLFGLVCGHLVLELCLVTWSQWCRSHSHGRFRSHRDAAGGTGADIGATNGSLQSQTCLVAETDNLSNSRSHVNRPVALNDHSLHILDQPSYTLSLCWHLSAVGLLFVSLQFPNFTWSDWTRLYDYGHLGLRFFDSYNQLIPGLPLSVRLVAHFPFLILAVSVAILTPLLIRLYCAILWIAMCCSIHISRHLFHWQPSQSLLASSTLVIPGLCVLGLITCETFGVLLFATHLLFQSYTYYHSQSSCKQQQATSSKPSTTGTGSDVVHSKYPIPVLDRLFYWHALVIIITVLASLFLVENWMEFLQTIDLYRNAGYHNIGLVFRNPFRVTDWHALSVLGAVALVDWHHGQLLDRLWSPASAHSHRRFTPSNYVIPIAYFFSGTCLVCLAGLFHTAIMGFRLAPLSAWATQAVLCVAHGQSAAVVSPNDAEVHQKSKSD